MTAKIAQFILSINTKITKLDSSKTKLTMHRKYIVNLKFG